VSVLKLMVVFGNPTKTTAAYGPFDTSSAVQDFVVRRENYDFHVYVLHPPTDTFHGPT
jgi:hypothetical protein